MRYTIYLFILFQVASSLVLAATLSPTLEQLVSSSTAPNNPSSSEEECPSNSLDKDCNQSSNDSPLDNQTDLLRRLTELDRFNASSIDKNRIEESDDLEPTLRQVLLLHRHGDRTPPDFQPKDPLKNEPFWYFHGLGHLTNRGKARLFFLGKTIRARYSKFLKRSVNKNQRISRSSGVLRCIESAQAFLAGLLPLNLPDSSDAKQLIWDQQDPLAQLWQPVNVQSVPPFIDGMLAESSRCQAANIEYVKINSTNQVQAIFKEYAHEGEILTSELGFEMDSFYKWFWASSLLGIERTYFADKVSPKLLAAFGRIFEAGNLAMGAYQSTTKIKRLRHGLLINDMLKNMKSIRDSYGQGQDSKTKPFVHYSAHDLTLVILLGMLDSWEQFPIAPDFGANLILELHQHKFDNEWSVKFYYMRHFPSDYKEIHIKRCEEGHPKSRCSLERFSDIMKPYVIDSWQAWMNECANDMNSIDPYIQL